MRSKDKETTVHPHNGILFSHKNEAWWSSNYYTKWNKSDRERQTSYDIAYMWKLKYDTNELINKTEIDSQT